MIKNVSVFILILFTAACTRLDFGLPFFSYYVKSEVDEMFDLNSLQKDLFEKHFSNELAKVKKDQFPLYADYLQEIRDLIKSPGLTTENVTQMFDKGTELLQKAPQQWAQPLEEMVLTLKPEQFKSFEEYFKKKIARRKDRSAQAKDREKQQLKNLENWIDASVEYLTKTQEDRLEKYLQNNPRPVLLSIQSQEHTFNLFKAAFPDPVKRQAFMRESTTDLRSLQLPEYVKAYDLYLQKLKDFVIDLSLNLNEKQKDNLVENIDKKIGELRRMAR